METKPIVVVGSLNFDLVAHVEKMAAPGETVSGTEFKSHPGGKGANQAAAIGRLGHPVYMMGRVGDDAFGEELRSSLDGAGVDTTFVATSEGSSGVALIVLAANGENSIVVVPGANALLTPDDLDANLEVIRTANCVLTQLEIPLATVAHLAQICAREGVPLILDPAPAQPLPPELLHKISWITPNEVEARFFSSHGSSQNGDNGLKTLSNHLVSLGPRNVLLKLGERGAYLATGDSDHRRIPACKVEVRDTTGAGDAFNGAFAVALARGAKPAEAAAFASAAAALSVTRYGALPSMPGQAEVETFLRGNLGDEKALARE